MSQEDEIVSTTSLKLLALVLMLIDHIAEFLPGMPIYLRYIGRLSAPIFFFCMVWGLHYTHNRKIYLLRLYIGSITMCLLDIIVPSLFGRTEIIQNNIFSTLFLAGTIISLLEYGQTKHIKTSKVLIGICSWQLITIIVLVVCEMFIDLPWIELILSTLLGSIALVEGRAVMLLAILILYFCKDSEKKLILGYGSYCLGYIAIIVTDFFPRVFTRLDFYFSGEVFRTILDIASIPVNILGIQTIFRADSWHSAFFIDYYQWMMIFALPLMLLYNGKKGSGLKYFFYLFYPIHILILYCLGIYL